MGVMYMGEKIDFIFQISNFKLERTEFRDFEVCEGARDCAKLCETLQKGARRFAGTLHKPCKKQEKAPHSAKVRLDTVPKGFEGRIFFVINADGSVEAHPVKNGDDESAFKLVR
jgi:hypothetical protein